MTTLRKAAIDVIERWDAPLWKDGPATAVLIAALRTALEAPEPEIKVLQAKCDAFLANMQMALEELEAMTAERDAYQKAADSMAMAHKAERDIYQKATDDWRSAYVTLSAHYDALMAAGKLALSSMECNQYAVADMAPHADVMAFNAAIEALKQAGVSA